MPRHASYLPHGVIPAVLLPFNEDFSIDEKSFRAHLRDVTATAQQIYGGNGFTLEYDVQLYFRRAKALQISWWPTRDLEELIAADVLDT